MDSQKPKITTVAGFAEDRARFIALYTDVHSASHAWLASSPIAWTAADATRLALCAYLVAAGARPAARVPLPELNCWTHMAMDFSESGLCIRSFASQDGKTTPISYICLFGNDYITAPETDGRFLGSVFPDVGAGEAGGRFTWICAAPGIETDLWSEWLPAGNASGLNAICGALTLLRAALAPLGYTVQVRIE